MLPAALIGLGAWRAIAATGVMSFVYLAATVAILGLEPWRLFFEITLPQQAGLFSQERIDSTMLFAPFFVLRELGMDPNFAMWMQVVLSIALMVGVIAGLRRLQDFDAQFVLVAMAAMLASPYMQSYELPLVALAAGRIVLHRNGASEVGSASLAVILGVVTIGALLSLSVFIRSGVNYMSPLLLVTFLAVLGQSLMQRPLDLQSTPVSARAA
jgi:hypothetical protein